MLNVQSFVFNPLEENTYILYDETGSCAIVDPGCYDRAENEELADFITENKLSVELLLNTHCHIDHILGNYFVKEKFGAKLYIPKLEEPVLEAAKAYAPAYGIFQYHETRADVLLTEGDTLHFGNQTLKTLFVPGHSPGHMAFYNEKHQILMGGDVLFYNSIGRSDLPGGDYNTLIRSIHEKLFTLPDAIRVYPGHGPETTIGFEKRTNPFCAISVK